MGLSRLLKVSIAALAGLGRGIRLASKTAVESVRTAMELPELTGDHAAMDRGRTRRRSRSGFKFGRRGKHKARLHGRRRSKRGSGRTAARIRLKARRHG